MDPLTIMAVAQGAGGALQKFESARLRRRAQREFKPYDIPSSAKAMLGKATSLATQRGVPGEDLYRARAQSSVAQGVEAAGRTAESPSDVLSVLQMLHGGYMDFEQNMATTGAQMHEQRQGQLMNALSRFSQFETERWQYNELYPYMQAMGEAGQVDEAGNQNIGSAISSGMSIYGAKEDRKFQNEQFDKWKETMFGGMNTAIPNTGYEQGPTPYSNQPWSPYKY